MHYHAEPKHTDNTTNDFIRGKMWINLMKKRLKGKSPCNKTQLKEAAVQSYKAGNLTKACLVLSDMCCQLDMVIANGGQVNKY